MKRAQAFALAGTAVFGLCLVYALLAGCSPSPAARGNSSDDASLKNADLVVYSSHPEELARVVVTEFRDRSGLKVHVIQAGTGEMLARLRREAVAAGLASGTAASGPAKSPCDVVWGGGAESLAANADLFEPYVSSEDAAIPAAYKAPDHAWSGFTVLPMAIGYNVRLLAPGRAPHSWKDLLEPRFKGAIAYADPSVSASSYTILRTLGSALSAGGRMTRAEAEAAFVRNLDGKLLPESSTVFPSVASGEFLVGLYHDEGARELLIAGSDLRIVYPADGTSAVPDGVALVRNAAHPAAARKFIDFVLGPKVAAVTATRFHRRSARADCPPPPGQLPLARIRLVDYDIGVAAAEKTDTLARFRQLRSAASEPDSAAKPGE